MRFWNDLVNIYIKIQKVEFKFLINFLTGLKSQNNDKSRPTATFATHSTYAQSASISMTRLNAIDTNSTLLSPTTAAQRSPSRSPSM